MKVFALRMVKVAVGNRAHNTLRQHVREILFRLNDPAYGCRWQDLEQWDQKPPNRENYQSNYLCDWMSEYCCDQGLQKEVKRRGGSCEIIQTPVGTGLHCCIRAAFDMAVAPSAGVVGFTVGDLRTMWKGHPLPAWLTTDFQPDLTQQTDAAPVWL